MTIRKRTGCVLGSLACSKPAPACCQKTVRGLVGWAVTIIPSNLIKTQKRFCGTASLPCTDGATRLVAIHPLGRDVLARPHRSTFCLRWAFSRMDYSVSRRVRCRAGSAYWQCGVRSPMASSRILSCSALPVPQCSNCIIYHNRAPLNRYYTDGYEIMTLVCPVFTCCISLLLASVAVTLLGGRW
jgi:hypothetical protein